MELADSILGEVRTIIDIKSAERKARGIESRTSVDIVYLVS